MTHAGRGKEIDNRESVFDAAGRFLAGGFGAGVSWFADAPDALLDDVDEHGRATCNPDVLRTAKRTDVEGKAAGRGVGQFRTWSHGETFGAAPSNPASFSAAIALADAHLDGPLEPLLRLVTLEDASQWPEVLRYLTCRGHSEAASTTAMRKVLYPFARVVNVDAEATGNAAAYRKQVRVAYDVLQHWLHMASWRFMKAHGWERRSDQVKPIGLSRLPKRTRPRFEGGFDWQASPPGHPRFQRSDQRYNKGRTGNGTPEPCREWHGDLAQARRNRHPAQSYRFKFYRALDDGVIHRGYDYWEQEKGRAQENIRLDAETPC